mgnify:CR=1 FL=1
MTEQMVEQALKSMKVGKAADATRVKEFFHV